MHEIKNNIIYTYSAYDDYSVNIGYGGIKSILTHEQIEAHSYKVGE